MQGSPTNSTCFTHQLGLFRPQGTFDMQSWEVNEVRLDVGGPKDFIVAPDALG
jgi:hypothetical protein